MDLLSLNPVESAVLTIVNPVSGSPLSGDDGEPITITLCGTDSAQFKAESRAIGLEMAEKKGTLTPAQKLEKLDADKRRLYAACTLAWSNNFSVGAVKLLCSKENALQLYTQSPIIFEQVESFIGTRSNFINAP